MSAKRKHMDDIDPGSIPLPDDCDPASTFPPLPPSPPPPPSPPAASDYVLEPESIPIPETTPNEDYQAITSTATHKPDPDLNQIQQKSLTSPSARPRKRRPQNPDETIVTLEDKEMSRLLGFSNFETTKGKQVPGNNQIGAVHVVKKRRYRQYMNRKGGFNRPLDKVA